MESSTARRAGFIILVAALALGCRSTGRIDNEPLARYEPGAGYGSRFKEITDEKLRVVLAFSGGGTRAAALSYGVLKALRDTEVELDGKKLRLLDEVSTISSVSGGSFASAYYGLYGDRIFEDFEERFLRRDIDAHLAVNLFRPLKLLRIALTRYTRSDMAMDVYDKYVFEGATFEDLAKAQGPVLNINATDIDVGTVFTFIQPSFNFICSDLSKLRVATAVTSSSAVPGVFAPILLANHAGTCDFPQPEWIREAYADPTAERRRYHEARSAITYLDARERPYVFLVDGGIADNIGARRILANAIEAGGAFALAKQADLKLPEKVIYIIVNSQAGGHHSWGDEGEVPSLTDVMSAISNASIYNYNFETVELMRQSAQKWSNDAKTRGVKFDTYVAEVAFDHLEDAKEREFFNGIETSFNLPDETIDRLIEVGGRLLRETPEFQKLLADLK